MSFEIREKEVSAFVCAVGLGIVYAPGDFLEKRAERLSHRRSLSFAAGVSIAYVFVDVLPELSLHNQVVVGARGSHPIFGAQRIYGLALVSFVLFYGFEHLVWTRTRRAPEEPSPPGAREDDSSHLEGIDVLHVAGLAVYSWLIGYVLPERAERGRASLALYTCAMALHFLIIDHSLREARGTAYRRFGRWILAASVPLGSLAGSILLVSEVTLARLFAFIAGGMLLTSALAELPTERNGQFGPFSLGAVAFAALLLSA